MRSRPLKHILADFHAANVRCEELLQELNHEPFPTFWQWVWEGITTGTWR